MKTRAADAALSAAMDGLKGTKGAGRWPWARGQRGGGGGDRDPAADDATHVRCHTHARPWRLDC